MKRFRRVLVLAALTLIVAMLALLAVADPFHLRYARWFTSSLVAVGIVLLTATLMVAVGRGLLRWIVVIGGAVAVLGWVAVVAVASQVVPENHQVSEIAEGGRRLVVLEGAREAVAPVYAVVVRSGAGPFEQESVVYQGVATAPAPQQVRFDGPGSVEVRMPGGCVYHSEVQAVTLDVDPVHRPLRADGC